MAFFNADLYRTCRILCVDPGLSNVGVSIFDVQTRTGIIENIEIESFITDKLFPHGERSDEYSDKRQSRLAKIYRELFSIAEYHRPSYFIHESPFYNPTQPNAFAALTEALVAMRNGVLDSCPHVYIEPISPGAVKKGVGAAGIKGKEIMKEKVFQIHAMMDVLNFDRDELTEHCIDSMAVGWAGINTVIRDQEGWR